MSGEIRLLAHLGLGKYLGPVAMATRADQYRGSQIYGNTKGGTDIP